MNKLKKTYVILWSLFLVISLLLIFTLPSIMVYYNGFSSATLQSLGVSNEAIEILSKSLDVIDGVLPKNLGAIDIVKIAASYITGYVPADFPANNLPVKFWGAVAFLIVSYAYNLWIVLSTLDKTKKNDDAFFNTPIILQSIICLVASIAVSLFMVINDNIYYVVAVIIYILLIIITVMLFHSTDLLKSHIKGIDDDNKSRKHFIDELKTECELLMNKIKDEESKEAIKKFYDEVKYSVSMSNGKTMDVEQKILNTVNEIKQKLDGNSSNDLTNEINNLVSLLKERNILAKK